MVPVSRAVRADAAEVLVDQVLELGAPALEAGRRHVGDVVGDALRRWSAAPASRCRRYRASASGFLRYDVRCGLGHDVRCVSLSIASAAVRLRPGRTGVTNWNSRASCPSSASSRAPAARCCPRPRPARASASRPAWSANRRRRAGRLPPCSAFGSPGVTMPILAIWPLTLLTVPSPAMVMLVSVGASWMRLAAGVEQRVAGDVLHGAVGASVKLPARVSRGPRGVFTVKNPSPPIAMSSGLPVCVKLPCCWSR